MKNVHASWHITAASWGILAGVALSLLNFGFNHFIWLIVGSAICAAAFLFKYKFLLVAAILGGVLVGLWLGASQTAELTEYNQYYNKDVLLVGKVNEDTTMTEKGEQRMRLTEVAIGRQKLPGEVWLSSGNTADIKRGDILTVQGKLNKGFGNIPASMFRAKIITAERPHMGDPAREIRDWFAQGVRNAIPSPQADLALGYLVGQRNDLPPDLQEQLKILGLTHVVVASGYNLTILVKFARRSLSKVSKYLSTFFAGIMIASFVLVTGFSPSMNRAALVTALTLVAWYYGRTIHPFVLLPFVAAITIAMDPSALWGDIGWYLSFASFAGVIILAPLINRYFWSNKKPGAIREIFIGTLSAQLATLPTIAYIFGQYSPMALPANLLILPLIPLTMVCTFFAGLAGLFAPTIAQIAGLPAFWSLKYMTAIVEWIGDLPFAKGEIEFGIAALVGTYLAIIGVLIYLWRKTKFNFSKSNFLE
jgi:competence protein ComEC